MPTEYRIKQGDCLFSIAAGHGMLPDTLWNDPANQALKEKRKDPNVLCPGDILVIPEKGLKEASCAADQCHTFRRKGVPVKLRLRLMGEPVRKEPPPPPGTAPPAFPLPRDTVSEDRVERASPVRDKPRADIPFVIAIGDRLINGRTDADGKIEVDIPPGSRRGRLIVLPGTLEEEIYPLNLGDLDPVSEISGVKERLANLGLYQGDTDDRENEALAAALMAFQRKHGLDATGDADDRTRQKLCEVHGK